MIITAPNYIDFLDLRRKSSKPDLFLAGSISGARNWQADAAKELQEYYNIFNPRRENFNSLIPGVEDEQITWEHYYLENIDNILFYFSDETVAPITLFEYGCYLELKDEFQWHKKNLFVAVHPEYPRKNNVIIQTRLRRPRQIVHIGLEGAIEEAKNKNSLYYNANIKICDNCEYSVDITTNKGHKPHCQFVWGRRGWRQLGVYDG